MLVKGEVRQFVFEGVVVEFDFVVVEFVAVPLTLV